MKRLRALIVSEMSVSRVVLGAAAIGVGIALIGGGTPAVLAHRESDRMIVEAERLKKLQQEALTIHAIERRALEEVRASLPDGSDRFDQARDVHEAVGFLVSGAERVGLSVGQVDIGDPAAGGSVPIRLETRGLPSSIVGMLGMLANDVPSVSVRSLRTSIGAGPEAGASLSLVWVGTDLEALE